MTSADNLNAMYTVDFVLILVILPIFSMHDNNVYLLHLHTTCFVQIQKSFLHPNSIPSRHFSKHHDQDSPLLQAFVLLCFVSIQEGSMQRFSFFVCLILLDIDFFYPYIQYKYFYKGSNNCIDHFYSAAGLFLVLLQMIYFLFPQYRVIYTLPGLENCLLIISAINKMICAFFQTLSMVANSVHKLNLISIGLNKYLYLLTFASHVENFLCVILFFSHVVLFQSSLCTFQ